MDVLRWKKLQNLVCVNVNIIRGIDHRMAVEMDGKIRQRCLKTQNWQMFFVFVPSINCAICVYARYADVVNVFWALFLFYAWPHIIFQLILSVFFLLFRRFFRNNGFFFQLQMCRVRAIKTRKKKKKISQMPNYDNNQCNG